MGKQFLTGSMRRKWSSEPTMEVVRAKPLTQDTPPPPPPLESTSKIDIDPGWAYCYSINTAIREHIFTVTVDFQGQEWEVRRVSIANEQQYKVVYDCLGMERTCYPLRHHKPFHTYESMVRA